MSNAIKVTFKRIHVSPLITSFELMEAVLTICSVSLRLIVIYRMPPSKINGLKTGTFYEEFSEYLEKLSYASGKVIILGDFNIYIFGYKCLAYKRFVGICGSALRLIRSYFSNRTQRVQIDGILSDLASLLCGLPQGSVLGPMKFCLYLLPLGAILRHYNIGYHIYADDTQLYILFKCKDPLESLTKLNMCISDIRV